MKKGNPELTDEQKARLYDLALLPDDQIDTGDISETDFSRSRKARGFFHSTNKREISLVLDDYVVDWFEENSTDGQDCHDYINMVLLEHIRQRRVRERREAQARLIWQHSLWESEMELTFPSPPGQQQTLN